MAGLKVGIKLNQVDLKNLNAKLAALSSFPGTALQIMTHETDQAVGRMKRDAPKDTHRLERNIEVTSVTTDDFIIKSEAIDPKTGKDYAPLQEYGIGVKGKPYFRHNIDLLYTKLRARLNRKLLEIARKRSVNIAYSDGGSLGSLSNIKNKITKYLDI